MLEANRSMSCCVRMLLSSPPSSFTFCSSLCLNVCACLSMRLSVYLLHFHPCHSFSCGRIKAQKSSRPVLSCVRSLVSITVEKSRTSSRASAANRIFNFISKEITPSRVKRGELWREQVLMSFMTLQITHYRREQNGVET